MQVVKESGGEQEAVEEDGSRTRGRVGGERGSRTSANSGRLDRGHERGRLEAHKPIIRSPQAGVGREGEYVR